MQKLEKQEKAERADVVEDVPKQLKETKVAIFVDGPNMLRKEFMVDLRELRRKAEKYGRVVIARAFVNQFAPEKLIEAIINEGFQSIMVLAVQEDDANDVDVSMACAACEAAISTDIEYIVLATRDADFLPVIQLAKAHGKKVVIMAAEPGFSSSLRNAADYVEEL